MDQSPRGHIYSQILWSTSVFKTSYVSVLKWIEIVILWVYYTIPFGLKIACFGTFWALLYNFLNYFVWLRIFWASLFHFSTYLVLLRITEEGLVPEIRMWSILLIKSDLKWRIHLSRSLFLYSTVYQLICLYIDLKDTFKSMVFTIPFLRS